MGRRLVVAFWVLVVATAAGIAVATVRAGDAKSPCTHGASSIAFSPASTNSGISAGTSPFTLTGCASDAMPPASRMRFTPSANCGSCR